MKLYQACIVSSVLLFSVIIGTFFNATFLERTADDIIDALDALPDDAVSAEEEILKLRAFWEERRKILSFTLSESSLDGISLLFDEICIAVRHADDEEYQKATARLRRAVESIRELEKISFSNIF